MYIHDVAMVLGSKLIISDVFQLYHDILKREVVPKADIIDVLIGLLCRLRSIAAHRDHFVRRLSVR